MVAYYTLWYIPRSYWYIGNRWYIGTYDGIWATYDAHDGYVGARAQGTTFKVSHVVHNCAHDGTIT